MLHRHRTGTRGELLTLLPPLDLLDLVHHALEDVAFVWLHAEAGKVTHVGRQQLSQLIDVAALQLPAPLLPAAAQNTQTVTHKTRNKAFQHYQVHKNIWSLFLRIQTAKKSYKNELGRVTDPK